MSSTMYDKAVAAYQAMLDHSAEDGEGTKVCKVSTVKFLEEHAGITQSQYSVIIGALKELDCILLLRRGGNKQPSEWAVLKEPDREEFEKEFAGRKFTYSAKRGTKAGIEQTRQMILDVSADVSARLSKLEEAVFGPQEEEDADLQT